MTCRCLLPRLVAVAVFATLLGLSGCAAPSHKPKPNLRPAEAPRTKRPPVAQTGPGQWLGRWVGVRQAFYLQIMPTARRDHYRLALRNVYAPPQVYDAWRSSEWQLSFLRGGERVTVNTGRAEDVPQAVELVAQDNCLILRSDDPAATPEVFCRRPGTGDALPLSRGTYTRVRTHCWNAMRDDLLYFDGLGLAHEGQSACHASLMRQEGVIFTVAENCGQQAPGSPTTEQQSITVADSNHFAFQADGQPTQLYQYCPGKPIPDSMTTPAAR